MVGKLGDKLLDRSLLGLLTHPRNLDIARAIREELRNFLLCHFRWMTFIVINNEALDPIDVSLLRTNAVMSASNNIAHLVEQFRFVSN